MTGRAAGTTADPADPADRRRRRAFRSRFVVAYGLSYATDAGLLALFAAIGTVQPWLPLAYGGAGLLVCGVFYALLISGASERTADPYLTMLQVLVSSAVMLAFLWLAPQVGVLFLCVLFLVVGFGSLRMSWREALASYAIIAAGTAVVLAHVRGVPMLPYASTVEALLVWLGFLSLLARLMGLGMVGNLMRVTLIKRQRQLRESLAALESRTRDLDAAKTVAESASLAKTRFLANVSHEIRTPMNSVIGFAELLLGSDLSTRQRERVTRILLSAQALLRVINDILDVARIEAGRLELVEARFDPGKLLSQVRDLLEPLAAEKSLAMRVDIGERVPKLLMGDEGRLRQVLVNLVANAVKFTERGEVRLALAADPAEGDAVQIRFGVSDTGIGMSPEQIGKLFTPFEQLDAGSARRFGGTGLGLHIAREVAQLMGGKLEVRSAPGQGTRFELRVSLRAAQPAAGQAAAPSRASSGQPLSLLLVEDNEVNREVARAVLEEAGHRVVVAADGAEALEKYAPGRFDGVLMDCQMPVMDGFEVTRRIRRIEADDRARSVPVVALTASAMRGERERCLAAGMDDFVAKPFDAATLLAAVAGFRPAAEPAPLPASFDPAALDDLLQLDRSKPGFLARLAATFMSSVPAFIASVAGASPTAPQEAQRAAHSLKSISARFGAQALAQLATQAEAAARDGSLDTVRALARAMGEEFDRAAGQMRRHPVLGPLLAPLGGPRAG